MKKSILTAIACFSICLTACGSEPEAVDTDVLSASNVTLGVQTQTDASVLTLSESSESNTENNIFNDKGLVPGDFADLDGESAALYLINLPSEAGLSKVSINGTDVDIQDITLGDMLETAGLTQCIYASTDLQLADYEFVSGMYGKLADKTDIFSFGSLLSIEIVDDDGNLVYGNSDIDSSSCAVKGIYTSDFFMQDDFDVVFYGGIKCGMPIEEAYTSLEDEGFIFGKSLDHSEGHHYCNGRQVMIIRQKDGIVDDIMLLNI